MLVKTFFGNLAKSGSGQIFIRIWWMSIASAVHSVRDKTNTADVSCGVFEILFSVTRMIKVWNPLPFHKYHQELANKDITKEALNCTVSIAADSIIHGFGRIVLWCQNKFSPNPALVTFEFLNLARSSSGRNWIRIIRIQFQNPVQPYFYGTADQNIRLLTTYKLLAYISVAGLSQHEDLLDLHFELVKSIQCICIVIYSIFSTLYVCRWTNVTGHMSRWRTVETFHPHLISLKNQFDMVSSRLY